MNCIKCGHEITSEMLTSGICFQCGVPTSDTVEAYERAQQEEKRKRVEMQSIAKQEQLRKQEQLQQEEVLRYKEHLLSTGYSFETCSIKKYVGLVSGESVIGTGWFSTMESNISDLFGVESEAYSDKIKQAKKNALDSMIKESVSKGGNAIIGISYEMITLSRDMIGVSVNGTSVVVNKKEREESIYV